LITLSEYGWGLRSSRFVAAPQHVVRRASVEDAEAIVQLGRVVDPDALATVEMFRRLLEREPAAATERLVAEVDGELAAWAAVRAVRVGRRLALWRRPARAPPSRHRQRALRQDRESAARSGRCEARSVRDGRRRPALPRRQRLRSHERPPPVRARPEDGAGGRSAAGVDVAPLRDVLDRAEELYRLFAECRADVPAVDARTAWTYDEWRVQTLDLSLLDHDASVVLLDADEPVSFAWPCRIGREVGRRRSWPARAGTVAGRGS
jgi:hypothetical protein